jgi:hypothetical protein
MEILFKIFAVEHKRLFLAALPIALFCWGLWLTRKRKAPAIKLKPLADLKGAAAFDNKPAFIKPNRRQRRAESRIKIKAKAHLSGKQIAANKMEELRKGKIIEANYFLKTYMNDTSKKK